MKVDRYGSYNVLSISMAQELGQGEPEGPKAAKEVRKRALQDLVSLLGAQPLPDASRLCNNPPGLITRMFDNRFAVNIWVCG